MDTFYCVGCRFVYPMEKAARITTGAHRDGSPVGFCFVCARDIVPADEKDRDADDGGTGSAEDTASA